MVSDHLGGMLGWNPVCRGRVLCGRTWPAIGQTKIVAWDMLFPYSPQVSLTPQNGALSLFHVSADMFTGIPEAASSNATTTATGAEKKAIARHMVSCGLAFVSTFHNSFCFFVHWLVRCVCPCLYSQRRFRMVAILAQEVTWLYVCLWVMWPYRACFCGWRVESLSGRIRMFIFFCVLLPAARPSTNLSAPGLELWMGEGNDKGKETRKKN